MKSYACGAEVPLLEKTIGEVLSDSVKRNPSGDAVVSCHQNLRLSYSELKEKAECTARGLWGMGVRPGDRVGMWAANCVEWVCLQVATALTGSVLVNVNPAYRSHELAFVLRKSRMKAIFLHERDARVCYLDILNEARGKQDLPLSHAVILGSESWDRMLERGQAFPERQISPEDVVNIQYTSGHHRFAQGRAAYA